MAATSELHVKVIPEIEGIDALTNLAAALADITDVQRLRLNPGDVLVVRCVRNLSMDEATRIRDTVQQAIPEHKVLVLSPELSLEAVEPVS